MKRLFFSFACLLTLHVQAQATFEGLTLPSSNYWKGISSVPTVSGFQSGPAYFVNKYDTAFGGYWSGWGYSALNDTSSTSYATNELGCIAGKGYNGSNIYGVAYVGSDPGANIIRLTPNSIPTGFYICNTTIAYKSMKNGDAFAKKFGGPTGNDPDFFKLNLTGWKNGNPLNDTVEIYLADFRDSNNANDYILNDWTWVNVSLLGACDSLTYTMESSDTSFGFINTPTYFCMDNLTLFGSAVQDFESVSLNIYPNPCENQLEFINPFSGDAEIAVRDIQGKTFFQHDLKGGEHQNLDVSGLHSGMYYLQLCSGQRCIVSRFTKH